MPGQERQTLIFIRGDIMILQGVYTALITPFRNGKVDYDALARALEEA